VTVGFLLVLLYQILYVLRVGIKRVLNRVRNKQAERTPTLATRRSTAVSISRSRGTDDVDEGDETDAVKSKDLDEEEEG